MDVSKSLIVLIMQWPSRHFPDRRLLRELLNDLRDEKASVLLVPASSFGGYEWPRPVGCIDLDCIDLDELELISHRCWRGRRHPWQYDYPEWRDELYTALRRLSVRGGHPFVVMMLAPLRDDTAFDLAEFHDFLVGVIKPAVIFDLRIGEADRPAVEPMPDARVLNYPEDRSEFLRVLRSLTGEPVPSQPKVFPELHALARQGFAERMAGQERPKITAAYPEAMAPACWSTVEVFLYLRDYRELVEKEIRRLHDREELDYSGVSSEFPKSLPAGCPIRISLRSNSLRTNPSELSIDWYEPYNRLPFRISPKDDTKDGYSASLDLDIFADDLPVASMRLAIAVSSSIRGERATPVESDAAWYENIFASYAREDLELVKHLKERYEALGLHMFIDLDDLRSGILWRRALFQTIDGSDLFQLFWSDHARQSEFVEIEWKHALQAREVKGGRFIRPVYWHEPMPAVPKELAEISFRRISFVEP